MRTSAIFGAKSFGFFEIYVCPHGQGEEGGGLNFSRFCADVFYGQPLMKKCSEHDRGRP